MGVLECDRRGCENIMCDRFSHEYGYLCYECFNELVGKKIPVDQIQLFMDTPKVNDGDNLHTEEFYNEIFKSRFDGV